MRAPMVRRNKISPCKKPFGKSWRKMAARYPHRSIADGRLQAQRGFMPALPIPYGEIVRALNFSYRDTRWHNPAVPKPRGIPLAAVCEGGIRLDIVQRPGIVVVMARPTDWTNFHSFSPNACLAKS